MPRVAPRPLTVHDYQLLPESGPRYQLIEGDLLLAPAPNRYHQDISRNVEFIFLKHLEKHPIGRVYHAPFDVVLTNLNVFQPDIVFVADKHAAILTTQGAEGAPDLVVEILSPRTAEQDVGPKRAIYARTGVEELWIIDPANRRVQVFRLQENADAPAATYGDQDTIQTPLMPGLEVHTADVFRQ